ncbi:MAG: sugar phosphate isomerase/epimerase [Chthoniobacteraceae bacterium]
MKHLILAAAALASTALAGDFAGEAGLQLYSLRDSFKKDVPSSLDKVKAFGVKEVELAGTYDLSADAILKELAARGLKPISMHFQYGALEKDIAKCVADAKALGLKYVACPWIPHVPAMFGMESTEKAAADFNKWGAAFAKEGITFAYHNHGYEFKPVAEGSDRTFLDVLMEKTDPKLVAFEMDVFWVAHPGADPVKYLNKYPGRWQLMHLKDIQKGARTGVYTGHAPNEQSVALGTGQIQWPAVLSAAAKSGVKHYFIEDEHPDAEKQIPLTLKYLQTLK